MQSDLLALLSSFPKLQLAITASNTAARSPKLAKWLSPFLGHQSRRVARLTAVSIASDATVVRRFLDPQRNVDCGVQEGTEMNPYEKLDHEKRCWSVRETARFLGFNRKYLYKLIHEGKIEGWMKVDGKIRFCPAKLKIWMETNFNGKSSKTGGSSPEPSRKENDHEAA